MNFDPRNGISMSKDLTLDTKYDLSVKSIEFFIFRGCGTLATPLGGRKVIFDPRNRISMSKNLTLDTKHDLSVKSIDFLIFRGCGQGAPPP